MGRCDTTTDVVFREVIIVLSAGGLGWSTVDDP